MKPKVEIHYCQSCGLLPRAVWMAQELLNTFARDLSEVALVPGGTGVFEVRVDSDHVYGRDEDGGFPEPRVIKQALRERI